MVEHVIDECIDGEQEGGYMTRGFERTLAWLEQPDTEFPGEPGNLYIRKSFPLHPSHIYNHTSTWARDYEIKIVT